MTKKSISRYALLMAAGVFSSCLSYAQFQMAYPHTSASEEIEVFDIAEHPNGIQLLALNDGKQELIEVDANGNWVDDYSVNIGTAWHYMKSKTMAVKSDGETVLAGISGTSLKLMRINSGSVQDVRSFNLEIGEFLSVYEIELSSDEEFVFLHVLVDGKSDFGGNQSDWYRAILKFQIDPFISEWITVFDANISSSDNPTFLNPDGKLGDMYPTHDGGIAYTGPFIEHKLYHNSPKIFAFELNASGNSVWAHFFIDPERQSEYAEGTAIYEFQYENAYYFYIAGISEHGNAVFMKTDDLGSVIWNREYNSFSVELEEFFIRAITRYNSSSAAVVGEHKTNTSSFAFSAILDDAGSPGNVNVSYYYPDYQRLTDIIRTQNDEYFMAGETRDETEPKIPGLLGVSSVLNTNCYELFDLDPQETYYQGLDFWLVSSDTEISSEEPLYSVSSNYYNDEDNCCQAEDRNFTEYQCSPQSIRLSLKGGGPYNRYLWSNGSTSDEVFVGQPGLYSLLTIDGDECWGMNYFTVEQSIINISLISSSMDGGGCNGSATYSIGVTGTTGILSYELSNSGGIVSTGVAVSPLSFSGLCTDSYTLTVSNEWCSAQHSPISLKTGSSANELDLQRVDQDLTPAVVLYPNPSSGVFQFEFDAPITGSIAILDLQGRTVELITLNETINARTDLSHLQGGSYFAIIQDGEGGLVERVKLTLSR